MIHNQQQIVRANLALQACRLNLFYLTDTGDSQRDSRESIRANHSQKGRKGAGVKGAGVANCRIFRSAVPSVVVWSILLVSLSGVKKKL